MHTILPTLFSLLLRVVLLVAGLVFALLLTTAFLALLAVWGLRAAWLKLTGRPVMPFGMRGYPRQAFEQVFRRAARSAPASRTPRADAAAATATAPRWMREVTDVEPK